MTNEKDREEAICVINAYLKNDFAPGLPENWENIPVFSEAVNKAEKEISRIRSEAVKAERVRICERLSDYIVHDVSKGPERAFFNLGVNSAINIILSPDQGTEEKEANRG